MPGSGQNMAGGVASLRCDLWTDSVLDVHVTDRVVAHDAAKLAIETAGAGDRCAWRHTEWQRLPPRCEMPVIRQQPRLADDRDCPLMFGVDHDVIRFCLTLPTLYCTLLKGDEGSVGFNNLITNTSDILEFVY